MNETIAMPWSKIERRRGERCPHGLAEGLEVGRDVVGRTHPMFLTLSLLLVSACSEPDDKAVTEETRDSDVVDTDMMDTDIVDSDGVDTDVGDSDGMDSDVMDTDVTDSDESPLPIDQDQDGSPAGVDCDDTNPARTPGAEERCDGVDNDCDGDSADVGAVSWLPTLGAEVPLTRQFAAGTAAAPVGHSFTTSGTLLLCAGIYHVGISVERDATVTLRGTTTRAEDVVLNSGGSTTVVAMGGTSGVQLRDLTLEGTRSCLFVGSDSASSLTDVVVRGCSVETVTPDATLNLTDTELDGGSTAARPGLIGQWESVTLLRADVHHYPQGGLAIGTTGPISLLQSSVHDNQSPGDGGGVSLDLANAVAPVVITLTGTTFEHNHAALRGGGFYLRKPEALPVTLIGGHVRANTANIGGAGMFLHQAGVEVSHLTLSDHAGTALLAYPTGAWSNLTCLDNREGCLYSLGPAPRSWTLSDSTLHRDAGRAITLSDHDTFTFTNVDFGAGNDANAVDVWFNGSTYDYAGAVSGACTSGAGCE
jgi:hypothetical protein